MSIDLTSIGIKKGLKYEVIITTKNQDNSFNAAPFGIISKKNNEIICKIFKTSKTLQNIINNKNFIVNITYDPILFTLSTIENIPSKYYDENNILKNIDAYFICDVIDFKESISHDDPVQESKASIIIAKVKKIHIKKKYVKPINRGISYLIESLVNYTRLDIVNEKKQKHYLEEFKESERIIHKVGSLEEKKAINILKEKIIEKGYKFD
ncbi:MAG: DUF447 family protein [Methanobacteriaceae archaeon]|jgi:hypothetical protein|nr:DUF447 family protein [Methanobacteriaceae archaeon]